MLFLFFIGFIVGFNDYSVISRLCLDVAGIWMFTFSFLINKIFHQVRLKNVWFKINEYIITLPSGKDDTLATDSVCQKAILQ